ncbi:MAG TPA: hypothetical protein VKT49_21060 [Bryobacteraceae bacterium]|nr:hypothetical protein [Bryobacteraceae bacterium]
MGLFLLLITCTCCVAGLVVALAVRKAASPKTAHPVTVEWIEELSVSRYQPMLRLLDERDVRALERRAGVEPERVAHFRRERVRLFREYLKRMHGDFASICLALKVVMLQADIDRPDLATTLVRARIRFAMGMILVQVHLILFEMGIGNVDVRGLLTLFDTMRLELRTLTPESAVWGG